MKAIQITEFGDADQLKYVDLPDPVAGPGGVLVQVKAAGVNFADIYSRRGQYPGPDLPRILGQEGAGIVAALGEGVTDFAVGDAVAWSGVPQAYAELAVVPAARLIKMPAGVDPQVGAAALLQGMTAHYLCHATYPVKPGDRVLVHAGAGGVGLLLIQMVKRLGGYVYTTVSTPAKAALAKEAGADEVILYSDVDFAEEIKRATNGQGVDVVYDAVGATTFDQSIASLKHRGMMVLYGQASGPVPPVPLSVLNAGSYFLTRPTLVDYAATREELEQRSGDVLRWIASGELKLRVEHVFPLAQAAEAHRALEGRVTTGKVVLVP
jgi:NADPH2:quinone reductase